MLACLGGGNVEHRATGRHGYGLGRDVESSDTDVVGASSRRHGQIGRDAALCGFDKVAFALIEEALYAIADSLAAGTGKTLGHVRKRPYFCNSKK